MDSSTLRFIAGCVALFFGVSISAAGGVGKILLTLLMPLEYLSNGFCLETGGGGINVPIFLIIFQYAFTKGTHNSYFVQLGNALAQTTLNFGKHHPKNLRYPLIYWDFVAILLPAQLGGSTVGLILSKIFPDVALYSLALVVLFTASSLSMRKGLLKYAEESEKRRKLEERRSSIARNTLTLTQMSESKSQITHGSNPLHGAETTAVSPELGVGGESDENIFNDDVGRDSLAIEVQETLRALSITTASVPLTTLAKEDKLPADNVISLPRTVMLGLGICILGYLAVSIAQHAAVTNCSTDYVVTVALVYVPLSACIVWMLCVFLPQRLHDVALGTEDMHALNEVDLTKSGWSLVIIVFCLGVLCALLGLGGGEVLSPLMLSLHLLPQVTSATSGTMTFLNSFCVVISLLSSRGPSDLDPLHVAIFFLVGLSGGLVGRYSGLYVAQRYGRSSVIIFALVTALYLSCVYYVYQLASGGLSESLNTYC